tara:strand:+ start:881 stop:1117 length:237 start_codon:yes stop_codon:yes gene_type:complete
MKYEIFKIDEMFIVEAEGKELPAIDELVIGDWGFSAQWPDGHTEYYYAYKTKKEAQEAVRYAKRSKWERFTKLLNGKD